MLLSLIDFAARLINRDKKQLCFSARGSYFLFNEKELFGLGNALTAQQTSNQIASRASSPNRLTGKNGFKIFVP